MKTKFLILMLLSTIPFAAVHADDQTFCDIYKRIHLFDDKVQTLEAIGAPYNKRVEIQSFDHEQKMRLVLDEKKFIELYLTFSEDGKLHNKAIAGILCTKGT